MGIKFANNASTNITHALTADATSVSVTPGTGNLFPSIVEGKDYFYATLAGNNGLEIVKVTKRVLDTMTIVRAQDDTNALLFNQGDLFELRIVAADFEDTFSHVETTLEDTVSYVETIMEDTVDDINSSVDNKLSSYLPLSGGTMTGTLRLDGNGLDRVSFLEMEGLGHGGFIDFHFNKDASDHTTRLIESEQGILHVLSSAGQPLKCNGNPVLTSAGGTMGNNAVIYWPSRGFVRTQDSSGGLSFYNKTPSAGAGLWLWGNDSAESPGAAVLQTYDKTAAKYHNIKLHSDGRFLKDNTETILTSAGGTMTGALAFGRGNLSFQVGTYAGIELNGNKDEAWKGATFAARAPDATDAPNAVEMVSRDGTNGHNVRLYPDGRFEKDSAPILTTADSATIAGYAMPSSRYIDLTLGAHAARYTASDDGYIVFAKSVTASGQYVDLKNESSGLEVLSETNGNNVPFVVLPVARGDVFVTHYTADGTLFRFRFVYAKGAA